MKWKILIPVLISLILSFTSIFMSIIGSIDARTDLSLLHTILQITLIPALTAFLVSKSFSYKNIFYEAVPILISLLIMISSIFIEYFFWAVSSGYLLKPDSESILVLKFISKISLIEIVIFYLIFRLSLYESKRDA